MRPVTRNWFGVAVGIASLAAMSGSLQTRRLHTWLFVRWGCRPPRLDEFRVFDSGRCRPSSNRSSFPISALPSPCSCLRCWAGFGVQVVLRCDLQVRRFVVLVAGLCCRSPSSCRRTGGVSSTSASRDHIAVVGVEQRSSQRSRLPRCSLEHCFVGGGRPLSLRSWSSRNSSASRSPIDERCVADCFNGCLVIWAGSTGMHG